MIHRPATPKLKEYNLGKRTAAILMITGAALILVLTTSACSKEQTPEAIEPTAAATENPAAAASSPTETTGHTGEVNGARTTELPDTRETTVTTEPPGGGQDTPQVEEATPVQPPEPMDEPLQGPMVERARAMAAAHLGLTDDQVEEVTLEEAAALTWPDSSLGCMQEGMAYAGAEVMGYRLTFAHDGRRVNAHGDAERDGVIIPQDCLEDPDSAGRPREDDSDPNPG